MSLYVVTHYTPEEPDPEEWIPLRFLARPLGMKDGPYIAGIQKNFTMSPIEVQKMAQIGALVEFPIPLMITMNQGLWLSPGGELCITGEPPHYEVEDVAFGRREKLSLPLRELRRMCNVTQEQLATSLATKQTAISRYEGRSDLRISVLRKYLKVLGAKLEVMVRIKGKVYRLLPFSD